MLSEIRMKSIANFEVEAACGTKKPEGRSLETRREREIAKKSNKILWRIIRKRINMEKISGRNDNKVLR